MSNIGAFGDYTHYATFNTQRAIVGQHISSSMDTQKTVGDLYIFPDKTPHLFVDSQTHLSDQNM